MDTLNYGHYFRKARESRGISQMNAAATLDITASFLSQIENNKKKPNVDLIFKAARLYNVEESYFFQTKEKLDISKLETKENVNFISDLGRLSTEELKEKYDMKFLGNEITDNDIKSMVAYLKVLKNLE